jgi:hypothetical protein
VETDVSAVVAIAVSKPGTSSAAKYPAMTSMMISMMIATPFRSVDVMTSPERALTFSLNSWKFIAGHPLWLVRP